CRNVRVTDGFEPCEFHQFLNIVGPAIRRELVAAFLEKHFRNRRNAHENARLQTAFYRITCHVVGRSPKARRQESLSSKKALFRDLLPIGSGHTESPLATEITCLLYGR